MRWENIFLNDTGGLIHIAEGKTKAARRMLPMVPAVYAALKLKARQENAERPHEGWVFPSGSRGHFNKDTAKDQHRKAIEAANAKAKKKRGRELKPFEPYILRHTALTQIAQAGADVFALARIAGHSYIMITQRYVHPQADAIERAFAHFGTESVTSSSEAENSQVGTNLGTAESCPKREPLQLVGAKGGTRTPTVLPARS
jgi:integrase